MLAQRLQDAIQLRKQNQYSKSRDILFSMVDIAEMRGVAYLNIAWSYDKQGLEQDALRYYLKACQENLLEPDKFEASFGLACTYRCLGDLEQAEAIFIQLRRAYPLAYEVIPFYAFCLISLGKKDDALRVLFELIIEQPPTVEILAYKKTIQHYLETFEYVGKGLG